MMLKLKKLWRKIQKAIVQHDLKVVERRMYEAAHFITNLQNGFGVPDLIKFPENDLFRMEIHIIWKKHDNKQ